MKKFYSLLAMVMINAVANAQGTNCNNAITIISKPTCIYQSYQTPANSNIMWFSFIAESTNVNISVITTKFGINAPHIHQLALGGGTCGNIVVIAEDELPFEDDADRLSIDLNASGLIVGQTYFIRVKREATDTCDKVSCRANNSSDPTAFNLCVENVNVIIPLDFGIEQPALSHAYHQNRGQLIDLNGNPRPDIKLYTIHSNPTVYITDNSISYVFAKIDTDVTTIDTLHRVDMTLEGTNTGTRVFKTEQIPGVTNYFLPHIPKGISRNKGFSRAVINDIYPNIDMQFYSNSKGIKYYFIVRPGGNADDIEMKFDGATAVNITSDSSILEIITPIGKIDFEAGHAYQINPGNQIVPMPWQAKFIKTSSNKVKLDIRNYPQNMPLYIQIDRGHKTILSPAAIGNLEWSTYYGGNGFDADADEANAVTTDNIGNIYFTGTTASTNFPIVSGGFQDSLTGSYFDAYILKFFPNRNLDWATYYGGSIKTDSSSIWNVDEGKAIIADKLGFVYISGFTSCADFPLVSNGIAYFDSIVDTNPNWYDAFIIKLNIDNGLPVWATFFGSDDRYEFPNSIALDSSNNLYVSGQLMPNVTHPDFPKVDLGGNAYFKDVNGTAFISKFNPNGELIWSTLFGSRKNTVITDIAIDKFQNLIIVGHDKTTSLSDFDFINQGNGYAQIYSNGITVGFIAKFTPSAELYWSTLFGGANTGYVDLCRAIAIDTANNIFIVGDTEGGDFPLFNPGNNAYFDSTISSVDIFISKFNGNGSILWSTVYGGSAADSPKDIIIDNKNNIFIIGGTASIDFELQNALNAFYQDEINQTNTTPGIDAFILSFNDSLKKQWATYFGGNSSGGNTDEAIEGTIFYDTIGKGRLFLTGRTHSNNPNIPLVNPGNGAYFQDTLASTNNTSDIFIAEFSIIDFLPDTSITKISNFIADPFLSVFPNPSTGKIYIKYDGNFDKFFDLNIYDVIGKNIYHSAVQMHSDQFIETPNFSTGIYFIQIIAAEKILYKGKIIIR